MKYARVITDLALDRTFDYKVPDDLKSQAQPGARVVVPFGRTTKKGFIVELSNDSDFPENRIKPLKSCPDDEPLIPHSLIKLGHWISRYYCCSIEQAIKVLLPGVVRGDKVKKKMQYAVSLVDRKKAEEALVDFEEKKPKYALVLKKLFQTGEVLETTIRYELNVSPAIIKTMVEKGFITREKVEVVNDFFSSAKIIPSHDLPLSDEQTIALKKIMESYNHPDKSEVFLLNGVTGSGKTEVYMQAIRDCLKLGQEAVVLVPEIALTPQTVERFRSRFGDEVSVLHSGLTERERFDEWNKIHQKKVKIVVGARSALFAPFRNLGLIIVDEEHEATYKQNDTPRYHARDVAVVRGFMEKATVVLGSATPSFESLYNVKLGKYHEVKLTKRHFGRKMPDMRIINLKEEASEVGGAYSIFSKTLVSEVYKALDQGEQIILFLNRRGFATSMQCLKCGYVAKCESCDRPFTYHQKFGQLICHYCNDIRMAPKDCPECQDKEIRFTGLGTERVEEIASRVFPAVTIARMDSDTMNSEKDYRNTLQKFKLGKIDILIGTQMIAKGLHFPNVTLVGILLADMGLHIPDFRAGEKTLQLITQVAGRAGRGDIQGKVLVQTLTPFHPALQAAKEHQYVEFFDQEIEARELFFMPPVCHMFLLHFSGQNQDIVAKTAIQLHHALAPILEKEDDTELQEVIPAPIEKIDKNFRFHLAIRTKKVMKVSLILRQALVGNKMNPNVKIHVDIDPYSLL